MISTRDVRTSFGLEILYDAWRSRNSIAEIIRSVVDILQSRDVDSRSVSSGEKAGEGEVVAARVQIRLNISGVVLSLRRDREVFILGGMSNIIITLDL